MTLPAVYDFDALFEATRPADPGPTELGVHGAQCPRCLARDPGALPGRLFIRYGATIKTLFCNLCDGEFRYE